MNIESEFKSLIKPMQPRIVTAYRNEGKRLIAEGILAAHRGVPEGQLSEDDRLEMALAKAMHKDATRSMSKVQEDPIYRRMHYRLQKYIAKRSLMDPRGSWSMTNNPKHKIIIGRELMKKAEDAASDKASST